MPSPSSLTCVRCGTRYMADHYTKACAACQSDKIASNLTVAYDTAPGHCLDRAAMPARPRSLWRWEAFLPARADEAVTLGEGDTPLLAAPALGLGDVWIKDESRNPTWSFKDRLASSAVTMSKRFGARLIVSSSSGNAGAAAAAYAAKAGLPCIVFTFRGASGPLLTQMRAYSAMVVMVEDKDDRWRFQSGGVRQFGWFRRRHSSDRWSAAILMAWKATRPSPTKSRKRWLEPPDWCVLPVCYGDALHGMWKGFEEFKALGWTHGQAAPLGTGAPNDRDDGRGHSASFSVVAARCRLSCSRTVLRRFWPAMLMSRWIAGAPLSRRGRRARASAPHGAGRPSSRQATLGEMHEGPARNHSASIIGISTHDRASA